MRRHVAAGKLAAAVAGAFLVGLTLNGTAGAITDTIFKYSTPKPGFVTIPPAAFIPDISGAQWFTDGDKLQSSNGSCFTAPVNNFPQGAKLTALAFWYDTNGSSGDALVLRRRKMSDNSGIDIVSSPSKIDTGGTRTVVNLTITNETIDNQRYFYYVDQCLSATENFYGVRIAFTYSNAGY